MRDESVKEEAIAGLRAVLDSAFVHGRTFKKLRGIDNEYLMFFCAGYVLAMAPESDANRINLLGAVVKHRDRLADYFVAETFNK